MFWFSIIAIAYLAALAAGLAVAAVGRVRMAADHDVLDRLAVDHRTETLYQEIARSAGQGMAPPAR